MKSAKSVWFAMTFAVVVSALGVMMISPRSALAAIRAAFVEVVLPSRPFNQSLNLSATANSVGPGASGTLGVTAITLTNFQGTNQTVFVFAPVFSSGSCGSTIIGGGGPRFYVQVPAGQTVHLTYPSPMVYGGISGNSCIAAETTTGGAVDFTVNGFVN